VDGVASAGAWRDANGGEEGARLQFGEVAGRRTLGGPDVVTSLVRGWFDLSKLLVVAMRLNQERTRARWLDLQGERGDFRLLRFVKRE
jgi:hypothetical protein